MRDSKLQSAMEYLMTYGWAILVIAIVLGVLYYFGVFSNPLSTNACIPSQGYLCQSPLLNSSGYLSISFSQISGSAITITGIACTNNVTPPGSNIIQTVSKTLQSGNQQQIIFKCPFTSLPIGADFSGYLWIQYSTATQSNLIIKYASITGRVSSLGLTYTSGALISNTVVTGYVPITLTNSQSSATGSNFQQMLTIDSATYANSIKSGWTNVEFTTGPNGGGSTIPAWVESGNSNSSASTVVWTLLSSGIGASSNTVVYMDFLSNNVMSASGPTGEAPELSGNYAQYDNGATVFNFYDNFAGSSDARWTAVGTTFTISNGMTIPGGEWGSAYASYSTSGSAVQDAYLEEMSGSQSAQIAFSQGTTGSSNPPGSYQCSTNAGGSNENELWYTAIGGSSSLLGNSAFTINSGVYYVLECYWSTPTVTEYVNYQGSGSVSVSNSAITSSNYIWLEAYYGSTWQYQWTRVRAYPPNGAMPTASFGGYV